MATTALMPEDADTRLTRAEERIRDHTDQLKQLWPLPAQYAVAEERTSNLREDLNEGFNAIRAELKEMKKDAADRAKERRTMLLALIVCGVGLFGTFVATAVPLIKGAPAPIVRESK